MNYCIHLAFVTLSRPPSTLSHGYVRRHAMLLWLGKYCLTLSQIVYCEYLAFPAEFLSLTFDSY